ncbi:cell division cycle 7-related protein kinase-like [Liolophura sinensis]|uniref:cell division cycle 7-related protein kinase-like n=1 Tax=Liolophura sinensis TaxID=3198878 RepID=UPI003157FA40
MKRMPGYSGSTEVVDSAGSDHEDAMGQNLVHTPRKRRRDVIPLSPSELPEYVQDEIDDLYDDVPEVKNLFKIVDKIGEGTFSSVFLARLRKYPNAEPFALKHIIPTSHPSRIEQELSCLQEIGGVDNVMGVRLCLRQKDHVVIVMPYFPHDKFQDYVQGLNVSEVRDYMWNLLLALSRVHQFDIIHRDVKPSNFLYNRATKQFALVDFGLAHKAPVLKMQTAEKDGVKSQSSSTTRRQPLHETTDNQCVADKATPILKNHSSKPPITKPNYQTPPTPEMGKLGALRQKKSPRRFLLARRMLLANQKIGEGKKCDTVQARHIGSPRQNLAVTCQCYGQPRVCSQCTGRSNQVAPRAGTPGFRSPEVLMKCPDQSTAVDVWSAGVIFLSLLSGRYPFFRANDDMTALAQIVSVMGSEEVKAAAKTYGKLLTCNPSIPRLDIKQMCTKLRSVSNESKLRSVSKDPKLHSRRHSDASSDKENKPKDFSFPDSGFDLLLRLLDLNPHTRITAVEALQHPFFQSEGVVV